MENVSNRLVISFTANCRTTGTLIATSNNCSAIKRPEMKKDYIKLKLMMIIKVHHKNMEESQASSLPNNKNCRIYNNITAAS